MTPTTMPAALSTEPVDLSGFFSPRRVAVIGASESSGWTRLLLDNLDRSPGLAEVALVNPRRPAVLGRPTVPGVDALAERPDLAFVMVGPERVAEVVQHSAGLGIRDFVVLSAGFGEAGQEGADAQAELAAWCTAHGVRLLGPNVSGFVNEAAGVRSFGLPVPADLPAGRVGMAFQSGGLATHVLSLARSWGIGLSLLATTGNEAQLDIADIVSYLVDDPGTEAIGVFLESVRRPETFRRAVLRAAEADLPVVALHVGRSALGRTAAQSHTGALVGDHGATIAALSGLGVAVVDSMEDLMATANLLSAHRRGLAGRRVAVVAASGGACELIADEADARGLTLPPFGPELTGGLARALPGFADAHNPLDVTGFVVKDGDLPFLATELVGSTAAGDYDVLILQSVTFPAERGADADAQAARFARLATTVANCPVPTVLQTAATFSLSPFALELVAANRLVIMPGIAAGIAALDAAARFGAARSRLARLRAQEGEGRAAPGLPAADHRELARALGVPFPPEITVTGAAAAAAAAAEIGCPVVLKINSPDIAHKTEAGGVVLDVRTPADAATAYRDMVERVARLRPDARIHGVDVVAMRPPGVELLVSVTRDPAWGPMLTLGAGGVLTELLADVATRPLPLSDRGDLDDTELDRDIGDMLAELRIGRLLDGFRGSAPADRAALARAIRAIVALFDQAGAEVRTVEVNPLRIAGDQVEALDLLVDTVSGEPA